MGRITTFNTKYYLDKYKGVVGRACSHYHSQPGSYPDRYVFLARRHDNIPITYKYFEKQRKYVIVFVGHTDKLFTVKLTKEEHKQRVNAVLYESNTTTGLSKPNYHYVDLFTGYVFPVWEKKSRETPCVCIGKFRYKAGRDWYVRLEGRKIMFRAEGKEHEKILTDEQNAMRIAHILTHPLKQFRKVS